MPPDLTPTRLRELIAAAKDVEGIRTLVTCMISNSVALADALEKAELLEWLREDMTRWGDAFRAWDGECNFIDAIRATKEAAK